MKMKVTGMAQNVHNSINKALPKFERCWSRFGGVAVSLRRILGTESDRNGKN